MKDLRSQEAKEKSEREYKKWSDGIHKAEEDRGDIAQRICGIIAQTPQAQS